MTFPSIPTTANGRLASQNQANTTPTRTFPSLTLLTKNSGDLLVAIAVAYQRSAAGATFSGWTGGFAELADVDGGAATDMAVGIATKTATGSETGTFAVTQADTVTGHCALFVMSIAGWHGTTLPELTALAVATGTAADPAALSPSWGADDTLWIAVGGVGETSTAGSFTGIGGGGTPPTNYGDSAGTGESADAIGAIGAAIAFRQNNIASEDIGPWGAVDTSAARNSALLIAVRPVAAAGGPVALDGVVAAISDTASSIDLAIDLSGPVAVVVDGTGTAQLAIAVEGSVATVADLAGAIETPVILDGSINLVVTGSVTAALSVYPSDIIDGGDTATPPTDIIISALLGEPVTDLAGDLTVGAGGAQALDGVIAAIVDTSGDLSVQAPTQHALAGIVAGVTDLAGDLTVEAPGQQALTGTIAAIADTAGTAQAAIDLTGPVVAVIDLTGAIAVAAPLQAASDTVAHLTGDLTVEAPGQQDLAGTIAAVTDLAGAVTADFVVLAVNDIIADLVADLTVILWGFNEPTELDLTAVDDARTITAVDDSRTLSAVPNDLTLVAVTED